MFEKFVCACGRDVSLNGVTTALHCVMSSRRPNNASAGAESREKL
jgi:hypothetical protein